MHWNGALEASRWRNGPLPCDTDGFLFRGAETMFPTVGPVDNGTFTAPHSAARNFGALDVSRIDRVTARMGDEILSYLGEKLSSQDIAFLHARGSRGKPHLAEYCFDSLVECLYEGPPGQSPAKAAAYYIARLGLETEISALAGMLANEALAKEARDGLENALRRCETIADRPRSPISLHPRRTAPAWHPRRKTPSMPPTATRPPPHPACAPARPHDRPGATPATACPVQSRRARSPGRWIPAPDTPARIPPR